jgi:hypothetical protein
MKSSFKQPWLYQPLTEIVFILLPPLLCLLAIILFPTVFTSGKPVDEQWWIILVLLIDVAHVYSTLYHTYFNPAHLKGRRFLLWLIPLIAFISVYFVYQYNPMLFWRLLAYTALYHFIRQQYGFLRLYNRRENNYPKWHRLIDNAAIYAATLYPMLYWHLTDRSFNWFIPNDFLHWQQPWIKSAALVIYLLILCIYLVKECMIGLQKRVVNIPKNMIMLGTVLSWYLGIVYFNGDLTFTLFNVVSHGIPYMALIWIMGRKQQQEAPQSMNNMLQKLYRSPLGWMCFLGTLFLLAYIEEGLWDISLWQEHTRTFHLFHELFGTVQTYTAGLWIPLLTVPQLTHYILDGFIWKVRKMNV